VRKAETRDGKSGTPKCAFDRLEGSPDRYVSIKIQDSASPSPPLSSPPLTHPLIPRVRYYCQTNGLTAPTGTCSSGYYCGGGAKVATPAGDTANGRDNDMCPEGYYCPAASTAPQPCPKGSYENSKGFAGNFSSYFICTPCPAKYACNGTGLAAPTGYCYAGYFCKLGSPYPNAFCGTSRCTSWWV
jgi:hypothetical protein